MSFQSKIEELMDVSVGAFIVNIAEEYDMDEGELRKIWNKTCGKVSIKVKNENKKNGCSFVLTRGVNSGSECGKKIVKDSNFCKNHTKKRTKQKAKTISPKSVVLKKHKTLPVFWHPQTGFVFDVENLDGQTIRTVVGKIDEFDDILQLDDGDIETCHKYKFRTCQKKKVNENEEEKEIKKPLIKLHKKTGKYWNPNTKICFTDKDNFIAIGRINKGKCVELNDKYIKKCKDNGWEIYKPKSTTTSSPQSTTTSSPQSTTTSSPQSTTTSSPQSTTTSSPKTQESIEDILSRIISSDDELSEEE